MLLTLYEIVGRKFDISTYFKKNSSGKPNDKNIRRHLPQRVYFKNIDSKVSR